MQEDGSSTLERLRDSLRIERECCASLVDVLRAERAAASGHDLEALIAALREREMIQARWRAAAHTRCELLEKGPARVEEVPADPALRALRHELAADARVVRREQAVNEAVLRAALDGVNELLSAIRRHLPGARYDGRASLAGVALPPSHPGWRA